MNEAFKGTGGILCRLDFVSIPKETRRQEVAICGGVVDNEDSARSPTSHPFTFEIDRRGSVQQVADEADWLRLR
jgi:hypothetical protein